LQEIAQANDLEEFVSAFQRRLEKLMLNSLSDNQFLVSKIYRDDILKQKIILTAASYYHKWAKSNNLPPITPGNPQENRAGVELVAQFYTTVCHTSCVF
jgi:hypothetical protein